MAHDGHHQTAIALRGDADVYGAKARHHAAFIVIARIDLRKVPQRHHHGARQERQQGQLAPRLAPFLVQLHAQVFQFGHVDFLDVAEVRNAALGLGHLLRDLAAQADDGHHVLIVTFHIRRPAARGLARALRLQIGVQVFVHDAAGRTAAGDKAQFNT
ncbi:hypothetical protein D3C73_1217010 [compost metagenome]